MGCFPHTGQKNRKGSLGGFGGGEELLFVDEDAAFNGLHLVDAVDLFNPVQRDAAKVGKLHRGLRRAGGFGGRVAHLALR